MTEPDDVLAEAKRVFGPDAELHYGARWATAGYLPNEVLDEHANEITVWGDDALTRMLQALKGIAT